MVDDSPPRTRDDHDSTEEALRDRIAALEASLAEANARLNEDDTRWQALQQSQLSLEALLDNLPGMAYRCLNDPQWTMRLVSSGCAALTGYAPDDLIHNRTVAYADLIHPEDRQAVWEMTQRSITAGQPFTYVYRILARDGQQKWVWEQGRLVTLPDDHQMIEGFITDITAQRNFEQALRESEIRYRTLFETMTQGVVFQNQDGIITQANPAAQTILGLTQDQILGRTSIDPRWHTIHEDGSPYPGEEHPAMVALRTGQEVRNAVMGVFNPLCESYRWIIVDAIPLAHPGKDRPFQVYTLFRDITAHRLAETALRESQAHLQAMFDNAASAIALLDAEGHYLQVNERWRAMFGYSSPAGLSWLDVTHPDDVSLTAPQYRALQTGELAAFQCEKRYIRADGSEFWGLVSARAVRNDDGSIDRIVQAIVDITAHKNAEAERMKLTLEQEKVNILARFIEDASHEFRTPLAVIYTGLELIERAVKPPPETVLRIRAMKEQAMYIGKLIDDMLAMSHFDSGPAIVTMPLDVNFLMRDLHAEFEEAAQAGGISLVLKLSAVPVPVRASPSDLHRALANIVQNALDFTAPGGTVTLESAIVEGAATVSVTDTGIGIAAKDLPQVFDRFFRANQARTGRHAGLGLTIARRIIELHGGQIHVTSEPGRGSVFNVVLPLSR